ncbi:hypothetical protein pb186bvf_003484 [Paramecium bursaria]
MIKFFSSIYQRAVLLLKAKIFQKNYYSANEYYKNQILIKSSIPNTKIMTFLHNQGQESFLFSQGKQGNERYLKRAAVLMQILQLLDQLRTIQQQKYQKLLYDGLINQQTSIQSIEDNIEANDKYKSNREVSKIISISCSQPKLNKYYEKQKGYLFQNLSLIQKFRIIFLFEQSLYLKKMYDLNAKII